MTIYYCADDNGFYDSSLKDAYLSADAWPVNRIEIADDIHAKLIKGQSIGGIISPDEHSKPVLVNRITDYVTIAKSHRMSLINEASAVMAPLQYAVDLQISTIEEKELLLAWKKYRVLLNRVDISRAPDIDWPDLPVIE